MSAVKINKLGKFDLNPRGNLWLKDENRFGHKLLSKMGWSQGKGLGKNEDGIAENLKVKVIKENTGVGWSEKVYFAEENDEYNAVLASLNQKFNSSENKPKKEEDSKSIEQRSQQFKNRMHYGKFVRGKDVCRYSEKDMNSIFITKIPKPEPSPPVNSTVTNIGNSSDDDSPEEKPIYKKSQMSMKEYFEMKMKLKSGKVQDSNNTADVKETEESKKDGGSSKKKRKNKKQKLDSDVLNGSPSKENAVDNIFKESEIEEKSLIENEVFINKKNKSKSKDESNILPIDTEYTDESSREGEVPKHSSDSAEMENVYKLSSKSRKSSKTVESMDPNSNVELPNANKSTPIEFDDMMEASWFICKSPEKIAISENKDEKPDEVVTKVSKKRKRKNGEIKAEKKKKLKTEVEDVSEDSNSSKKEIQSDLVEFIPLETQVSDKKHKKLSAKKSKISKLGKLSKLKSCLKGSVKYSLKQESRKVSFNDKVFYRTINSDTDEESTEEAIVEDEVFLPDITDVEIECNGVRSSCNETLETVKHSSTEMEEECVPSCSDASSADALCNVDSNEVPACMKLPKCDPNNYDWWLENQRTAIRMKIYKNMIKEIKKHPILRTSNMLDLKGYGNWGL